MARQITFNQNEDYDNDGVEAYTTAGYETDCPWCDELVLQGDHIVKIDGEWGHVKCPTATDQVPCKKCFLVHAGDCW